MSGRQARWLEKISAFDFDVEYVPGADNVLADALSRIYTNDAPGTVRAPGEYVQHDEDDGFTIALSAVDITAPVFTAHEGAALMAVGPRRTRSRARSDAVASAAPSPGPQEPVAHAARMAPADLAASPPLPDTTARLRPRRTRKPTPGADTGRPETSKEFARRIKRVVLHGPRAGRQEGEPANQEAQLQTGRTVHRDPSPAPTPDRDAILAELQEKVAHEVSLLTHLSECVDGIDLLRQLEGRYGEDEFFRRILEKPRDFKNFRVEGGLVYLKQSGREFLCIPDITHLDRSVREIVISHAHSLLAHLGAFKTLSLLRDHFWWKSMTADVRVYCDSCRTCKRSKPNNQKPYGPLNPLKVPTQPWEAIGIDFVGPLPESRNRDATFDMICVIICLLTGMVHLVPCRESYTARQMAELIFAEVYKHHGLPRAIISDRDKLFTSTFWSHLHRLIGVELRMSSAYHPQSDGSTERANHTVTQLLRQCISPNQKDWVSRLPAIEFAINLARSDTTGYAPFFLNTGRMPRSLIWNDASSTEYAGVRAYAQRVKQAVMTAHDSIIAARVKQTREANRRRRAVPFEAGDLVYISSKNLKIPRGLARKLVPKFVGPYRITRDFGNFSYLIEIPASMKQRGVHPVFHASLLRVHEPNDDRLFPGRLESQVLEVDDPEDEWVIERIKTHRGKGLSALFEVLWTSGDVTWVPLASVASTRALAEYLEASGLDDAAHLPYGEGQPPLDDPQVYAGSITLPRNMAYRRPRRADRGGLKVAVRPPPAHRASRIPPSRCTATVHTHPAPTRRPRRARTPTHFLSRISTIHLTLLALFVAILSMAFREHRYAEYLQDGALSLRNAVTNARFTVSADQLARYREFDVQLRGHPEDDTGRAVPLGYDDFVELISQDRDFIHQFCVHNVVSGAAQVVGTPMSAAQLSPRTPLSAAGGLSLIMRALDVLNDEPELRASVEALVLRPLHDNRRGHEAYLGRRQKREFSDASTGTHHTDPAAKRARTTSPPPAPRAKAATTPGQDNAPRASGSKGAKPKKKAARDQRADDRDEEMADANN